MIKLTIVPGAHVIWLSARHVVKVTSHADGGAVVWLTLDVSHHVKEDAQDIVDRIEDDEVSN
jgi:hypothetical protein